MSHKMNLIDKLHQEIVIERIRETDWEKGNSSPLVVELDTTAVCNLSCPGCISEDLVAAANSFTGERLLKLGNEFIEAGVKAVILIGGGEPLAHRKAGDFIALMGKNDVHVGITTNGYYIDKYIEEISLYSQWTRVSVDAATKEMFGKLRPAKNGKSAFEKVIKNMRKLAKNKKGKLGFSFLIRTEADYPHIIDNIHEIYDAAVLAKDIGCDYFEIKPTYQYVNDVPHALVKHDSSRMAEARKQIDRLTDLEDGDFKIIHAINLEYSLSGNTDMQPKRYKDCPSTHLRTTVTPTGVYVCPYWRGKDHMYIGSVVNISFAEMWVGDQRKKVLDMLDAKRDCPFHCLRHATNIEAMIIKDKLNSGEKVDVIAEFDRFI